MREKKQSPPAKEHGDAWLMSCTCWSWTRLGELYCPRCIHWGFVWPLGPRHNSSWWRIRSPCICWFGDPWSPSRTGPHQRDRKAATRDFLRCREPDYRRRCTTQIHSWHCQQAMGLQGGRQPVVSTCWSGWLGGEWGQETFAAGRGRLLVA